MCTQYYFSMLFFLTLFLPAFSMNQQEKIQKKVRFNPICTVKTYKKDAEIISLLELEIIELSDAESRLRTIKKKSRNAYQSPISQLILQEENQKTPVFTKSICLTALGISALCLFLSKKP